MIDRETKIKRLNSLIEACKKRTKVGYDVFICNLSSRGEHEIIYSEEWYTFPNVFLEDLKILEAAKECKLTSYYGGAFEFIDIPKGTTDKEYNKRKLQILELALTLV